MLTVYEPCGSDTKTEGYDESSASRCCNADGTAVVESGSAEMSFDHCTVGQDTLGTAKENDIGVVKVLDEESDLPEALLPELGTHRKASPEVCFVEPGLEQSQEGWVKEESFSSCNFPLVAQETHLKTNQ